MALVRKTHWFTPDQLVQLAVAARKRGVSQSHYMRSALDFQLGRDSARDEIDAIRNDVAGLREELAGIRQQLTAISRRLSR